MKFKQKFISGVLSLGLVVSSLFVSNAATQQLEVHHINVGQGESIYIELPDGTDVLIDAGKSNQGSTVVNYLKSQEKDIDIEYLIATHPDADHIGGMQQVFKDLKVKNFIYPKDAPHNTQTWKNVLSLASSEGCTIKDSTPGTTFNIGGAVMKFIQSTKDFSDNNDDSVVTYLDYNNAEFLFTGDIEAEAEKDMVSQGIVPNVDFMSVPHHGSKGSSTTEFLAKADPEYAIVSVGENSYGHPTKDALNRYSAIGSKIYRTDKLGNIVIKTDGNKATINGSSVNIGETVQTQNDDVTGHWAEKEIREFMKKGYVKGYEDGSFKPFQNITRAEFVTIFNNYFNLTKTSQKVFDDTKSHWAKTAIDIAVTNGVCSGISSTKFYPNAPITREEMAVMISNYKKISSDTNETEYTIFDDIHIPTWAIPGVNGVINHGYMNGCSSWESEGYNYIQFIGYRNTTRCEAVATLSRIDNK